MLPLLVIYGYIYKERGFPLERPVALAIAVAADLFLQLVISFVQQAALSRCALAIGGGLDSVPLVDAHAPAHAPAPDLLSPKAIFLSSEKDIEGLRLSYGSIGLCGVVAQLLTCCGRSRCAVNTRSYDAGS